MKFFYILCKVILAEGEEILLFLLLTIIKRRTSHLRRENGDAPVCWVRIFRTACFSRCKFWLHFVRYFSTSTNNYPTPICLKNAKKLISKFYWYMYIFFIFVFVFFISICSKQLSSWVSVQIKTSLHQVKYLEAVVIRFTKANMFWKTTHNFKENTLSWIFGRSQHVHKKRHCRVCFFCNFMKNFNTSQQFALAIKRMLSEY